jgi:hypothetical protein
LGYWQQINFLTNEGMESKIDIKDLRVGSILLKSLKSGRGVKRIEKIGLADLINIEHGKSVFEFESVALTSDILVKAGFIEVPSEYPEHHPWSTFVLEGIGITMPYFEFVINEDEDMVEVKTVHHLQAILWDLAKIEITL